MSSFLPSRRGSLRVATTVPTTRARIMRFLAPVTYRRLVSASCRWAGWIPGSRADAESRAPRSTRPPGAPPPRPPPPARAPPRPPPRRRRAGIGGRAHRGYIPADHGGDVTRTDLLPAHQVHLGSLHHRVGGLDHGYQTARFDHS